jgi:outer membrane cobalamin receptor
MIQLLSRYEAADAINHKTGFLACLCDFIVTPLSSKDGGVFLYRYIPYIFLLTAMNAVSQTDSLRRYSGDTVLVSGIGSDFRYYPTPSECRISQSDEILRLTPTASAAAAFTYLHPSLDVRAYGTQNNLTLASFRGLPSEYIIIQKNGVRLGTEQNQLTDLAKYSIRSSSQIEVLTGINAALLGGDIASAVINVESYPLPFSNTIIAGSTAHTYDRSSFDGGTESFLTATYCIAENIGIGSTIVYQQDDGKYPVYRPRIDAYISRTNNDGTTTILDISPYWMISSEQQLGGYIQWNRSERGIAGAVTSDVSGSSSPLARQYDNDYLTSLKYQYHSDRFGIYSLLSHSRQFQTYTDPNIKIADEYTNILTSLRIKSYVLINEQLHGYLTFEEQRNGLESNQNLKEDSTPIQRDKLGIVAALSYSPSTFWSLSGLVRYDSYSDISNQKILPSLSVEYKTPNIECGISGGNIYHPPTFNQLYWRIGGNPELDAEEGFAGNGWLRSQWQRGNFLVTAAVSGFYHKLTGQIIWMPGERGIWSPKNILSSRSIGGDVEMLLIYTISKDIRFNFHPQLSYLDSRNLTVGSQYYGKELPYNPRLRTNMTIGVVTTYGDIAAVYRYRSTRFTDIINERTTALPASAVFDLMYHSPPISIGHSRIVLNVGITNLTNEHYEEAPSYPLPGRIFYLGFEAPFDFSQKTDL